ncbi:hypothetical protein PtB15_14B338 [Puccinia triticina]|nr:hypothetical protein PtB15_14B338 [Puccinia triticina]
MTHADHGLIKESSTPRDNTLSVANATQGSGSARGNVGSPIAAPAPALEQITPVKPPPTQTVRRSLQIFQMPHDLGHFATMEGYTKISGASGHPQH